MNRDFNRWLRQWARLGVDKSETWVKRVLPNGGRESVEQIRDYSRANRDGSRGVCAYYALASGLYEINERYKLNKVERYFVVVEDAALEKLKMKNIVFSSEKIIYEGSESRLVVQQRGDEYDIIQLDYEDGRVWNETPCFSYPSETKAREKVQCLLNNILESAS